MKSGLLLLPFVGRSFAATIQTFYGSGNAPQVILNGQAFDASPSAMEGYNFDLDEERLVQMEGKDPVRMTEREKFEAQAKGIKFFDVTDTPDLEAFSRLRTQATVSYTPPRLHEQVTKVIQTLSTAGPRENLEKFSSFWTRHYRHELGRESQQWLLSKVIQVTDETAFSSLKSHITVEEFKHSWGQNTIIARINGSSQTDDRVVIISAHLDSASASLFEAAPGADDDGSGTVTILESYRALLASGFVPRRPVEFHWYSAERAGVRGSQAVVQAYAAQGLEVYAMHQFDTTAWVKRGTREEVGVIEDYVDHVLAEYNKQLIDAYLSIPYVETKCGYMACSDHASWDKAGYPASFTFGSIILTWMNYLTHYAIEAAYENGNWDNINSNRDRMDISTEFSFEHMLEFSKLAVAFATELRTI